MIGLVRSSRMRRESVKSEYFEMKGDDTALQLSSFPRSGVCQEDTSGLEDADDLSYAGKGRAPPVVDSVWLDMPRATHHLFKQAQHWKLQKEQNLSTDHRRTIPESALENG